MIHCDAGPNIVRAYPVKENGAGYTAEIVNLLEGTRDRWFRPSDVCVAPDGSLIVADWYDPGVGGHAMGDIDKGRIFRIAPPGANYVVPKLDCLDSRRRDHRAQEPESGRSLPGVDSSPSVWRRRRGALAKMFHDDPNVRFRARALWLLSKLPGKGVDYLKAAVRGRRRRPEGRGDSSRARIDPALAMDARRPLRAVCPRSVANWRSP